MEMMKVNIYETLCIVSIQNFQFSKEEYDRNSSPSQFYDININKRLNNI